MILLMSMTEVVEKERARDGAWDPENLGQFCGSRWYKIMKQADSGLEGDAFKRLLREAASLLKA